MPIKAKDEEINELNKKATKSLKEVKPKKNSKSLANTNVTKQVKVENTVKESKVSKKSSNSLSSNKKVTKRTEESTLTKKPSKSTLNKKASASTSATKKTSKKSTKKIAMPVEYYDLPSSYNKTVVKVLAQTPSCLFVYWEISKKDFEDLLKQYGKNFFEDTKPYLLIINETMNYSFEVEINDYANSWYIHINDSDCKYVVKLIRKPINNIISNISYSVDIKSSNEMDAPNDHILFDKLGKTVFFKNVKTNVVSKKDIATLSFISNIGRIYNIYDFYKKIYKNELQGDELGFGLSSSQFSSTLN